MPADDRPSIRRKLCFHITSPDGKALESHDKKESRNNVYQLVEVEIGDIRGREAEFILETHSFAALPSRFIEHPVDYATEADIQEHYVPQVKKILYEKFPDATEVITFHCQLRTASTPESHRYNGVVHIDQSANGALTRAERHLDKETFDTIARGEKRFAIINLWKPINGPVTDHPLVFADCRSIKQSDLITVQRVYPDFVGERYALKAGSHQRYWWWSGMTEQEALLLKIFDSAERAEASRDGSQRYAQCAHAAFQLRDDGTEAYLRESIEVRCLVVF